MTAHVSSANRLFGFSGLIAIVVSALLAELLVMFRFGPTISEAAAVLKPARKAISSTAKQPRRSAAVPSRSASESSGTPENRSVFVCRACCGCGQPRSVGKAFLATEEQLGVGLRCIYLGRVRTRSRRVGKDAALAAMVQSGL